MPFTQGVINIKQIAYLFDQALSLIIHNKSK